MLSRQIFGGRRYGVLGLARSGLASARALLAAGADVLAWDRNEDAKQMAVKLTNGAIKIGALTSEAVAGFDGIIVSPGVPLNSHPIGAIADAAGVPVIGDIELFAQARSGLPAHKVIGITGTNGKSTTTALVHHILAEAGIATRMGGNIGLPVLAGDPLDKGGIYVLELSSYQLDITRSLNCEAAALLNITPDHLDRYDADFEAYAAAKASIFKMQDPAQIAVVDKGSFDRVAPVNAVLAGRAPVLIEDVSLPGHQEDWPALQGPHNLANAAAAAALARAIGVDDHDIAAALHSFRGLPHRMERVQDIGGITFINDSKATNPASSAPALAAFPPGRHPRIHWILGGLAKGDDLGECAAWLPHVAAAYTIGEAGDMFARLLDGIVPVVRAEMLGEAVRAAALAAAPGDVVLLSPACASFDQFRDYEKRGLCFTQLVAALAQERQHNRQAERRLWRGRRT
ncbi:UDP-N-acetylmuramoyl-L-alanine--D-glutamate ligase [Croceicoccus sp. F390]|uniref:UDP-N-acetylmuramoylalanine--D-glutamate ligase n=1 Tax=Croceicoccus esteveae TaxID=3075597 RepID=A0ABU2ZJC5_9SPHN|nr:UDP-N-acetylmuramoyl-L-alanine--D-glutamate ligase [Croceicoccus sp. F390]MDT0575654.1 UDP-N-acetylmuramoyl-L-alanine--D-glutamate ligase [Croceicoccus sp. F390]